MGKAVSLEKPSRPGRIVCVDDDDDIRSIVRDSFEMLDDLEKPVVATCGSGKEFFARVRVLQPSLILLDINMPYMNGLDFISFMRDCEDTAEIPVIFLTGDTNLEMEERYQELGVIGVIHKPFLPSELPDQVYALWEMSGFADDSEMVMKDFMGDDLDDILDDVIGGTPF